ncbi:plastocyanin/azurin family copper-binding protein [Azoarcus olearius]|uniref:Copper tolerance protein n=1 Tax=Azoarcus sp. (strain BH72) TaxID=418699 RepID=A1K9R2_AZOSB|nr:cupredoxin family protein [Azoarcus olearius]CAL95567.1 putative copper tolerance protein [Azoarcus olearius]
MTDRRRFLASGLAAGSLLAIGPVFAHGDAPHAARNAPAAEKVQQPWGIAGERRRVDRSIAIAMSDDMRFSPDRIEVRRGETIRFVHSNRGQVMHEMVIGTPASLDEHAALMEKFPGMEHDDPWMAHVAPGGSGEMIWHFNRAGEFEFACLIPGHYQAGMKGRLVVK